MTNNKKLGRGLSALLGEAIHNQKSEIFDHNKTNKANDDQELIEQIALNKIIANPDQPRKNFNHEQLDDLANSIKENGVIQPIIVRKADIEKGIYEIIAGERRFRASKIAGLETIPAIVKNISNLQALEFAIIENIQRADLSAIEEANSYRKLIEEFSYNQEQIAHKIGRSRSHIANILRLLSLPKEVQKMIDQGTITMGHAKTIVNHEDAIKIANKIIKESLSVRQTEELVQNDKTKKIQKITIDQIKPSDLKKRKLKNQYLRTVEKNLAQIIGNLKIKASYKDDRKGGKITIFYHKLTDIEKLIKKLEK